MPVSCSPRGGKLQGEGKLPEARQAAVDAQKCRAVFSPDEDTPEQALQELAASARHKVDYLVARATEIAKYGAGDPAARAHEAQQNLAQARALAVGLARTRPDRQANRPGAEAW